MGAAATADGPFRAQSKDEIKKATTTMIRTLIMLAQTMQPLPGAPAPALPRTHTYIHTMV
jgi:hypothetical protein